MTTIDPARAEMAHQPVVEVSAEENQAVITEAVRHNTICAELGKMAPRETVVVDYRIEGRQSFCTPVRGIIYASLVEQGNDLGEHVLHTTQTRERLTYPRLVDDLNKLADADRAQRAMNNPPVPPVRRRDK